MNSLAGFFAPKPQPEMPQGRPCVVQVWGELHDKPDWRTCGKATTHPAPTALDFPICDECYGDLR